MGVVNNTLFFLEIFSISDLISFFTAFSEPEPKFNIHFYNNLFLFELLIVRLYKHR